MKRRLTILALIVLAVLISAALTVTSSAYAGRATQISGIGEFDLEGKCLLGADLGSPDFANRLTGDLDGCFYAYVKTAECSAGGIYRERGTNLFVGKYKEKAGTFEATYQFMAKFATCEVIDGVPTPGGDEFFGRCHHPIIADSGTADFAGVTGRLDFEDNVELGQLVNFPYRGHLRWELDH